MLAVPGMFWVTGQILCEVDGIPLQLAKTGSQLACQVLPLKSEFVSLLGYDLADLGMSWLLRNRLCCIATP